MSMANIISGVVREYPDKMALSDGRQSYTYAELDQASNNFAAYLVAGGINKGDRVALCAAKSAPLIAAIIGVMKAGAIYVPIDSRLPKDRMAFIINDISPHTIVATESTCEALRPKLDAPSSFVDVAQLPEHFGYDGDSVELPTIEPEDVAYCLYTSGSTGRPKGVLIQHGSVDAFYPALAEIMTIDPSSRCMNTSALYFDVHVMDLFFPLHRGATLFLTCGPIVANKLLRTIESEKITHFTAVGPIMTLMTEGSAFATADLSSLVRVMTGAEIINVETMQKWLRRVPGLSLVNGYGPTEATVICTAYIIDRVEPERTAFYPIGKPMLGSRVLIVDDEDQVLSAPGERGELLLGGPQVMLGYWNNEDQTRERIVHIEGERYYRSGDLCEWREDGNLEYIGRNDEEIKLSGFRINLNEIKRVLDAADNVREGHIVVATPPNLGKVIVACFLSENASPDEMFGALQRAFKQELPYYMIPSLYFMFDRFPSMPSGKTDKKAILRQVNHQLGEAQGGATRFVVELDAAEA